MTIRLMTSAAAVACLAAVTTPAEAFDRVVQIEPVPPLAPGGGASAYVILRLSDDPGHLDLGVVPAERTGLMEPVVYERLVPRHEGRMAYLSREGDTVTLSYFLPEGSSHAGTIRIAMLLGPSTPPDPDDRSYGLIIVGRTVLVEPVHGEPGSYVDCHFDYREMTYRFASRKGAHGESREAAGSIFDLTRTDRLIRDGLSAFTPTPEQPLCDLTVID